jgi:hypothetical protein
LGGKHTKIYENIIKTDHTEICIEIDLLNRLRIISNEVLLIMDKVPAGYVTIYVMKRSVFK